MLSCYYVVCAGEKETGKKHQNFFFLGIGDTIALYVWQQRTEFSVYSRSIIRFRINKSFEPGNDTNFAALYRLTTIIPHREYSSIDDKNDIALIQTSRPMSFNEAVGAVCLPFRYVLFWKKIL